MENDTQRAEFQPSALQATDENCSCSICYSGILAEDVLWHCARCRSPCHLRCALQWVLRTVINAHGSIEQFTCPVCRTAHAVSSLPGFENSTRGPSRDRAAAAAAAAAAADPVDDGATSRSTVALLNLFSSIFPDMSSLNPPTRQRTVTFIPSMTTGIPVTIRTVGSRATGRGEPSMRAASASAAAVEDEDEDEDDDELEDEDELEDDDELDDAGQSLCTINTHKLSINIETLTINYNRT